MHGKVGASVEQCGFKLLDEQPLATHLGQRTIENLVAAGGHAEQFDAATGIQLLQSHTHMLGLPQGETTFSGGDDDALGLTRGHVSGLLWRRGKNP
jgi:hypothetical protein